MTVLAVAMQKGGIGKTTTRLSLAVEPGRLGRRAQLVDMGTAPIPPGAEVNRTVWDVSIERSAT